MRWSFSKGLPILLALAFFGCRSDGHRSSLVSIAKDYASQHGWDVARYEVETDSTDPEVFVVYFTGKDKRPGNHFAVQINKITLTCRLNEGA